MGVLRKRASEVSSPSAALAGTKVGLASTSPLALAHDPARRSSPSVGHPAAHGPDRCWRCDSCAPLLRGGTGAFLRRAFRDPIALDTLVSRSRPGEREVRFVTALLPVSVATFTDARAAARRVVRALSHRCPVASAFGLVAPSPRSGGWHAHFILTVPTIAPSVARQVEHLGAADGSACAPPPVPKCGGRRMRRLVLLSSPRLPLAKGRRCHPRGERLYRRLRRRTDARSRPCRLPRQEPGHPPPPGRVRRRPSDAWWTRATPATHRRSRSRPPAAPRRPFPESLADHLAGLDYDSSQPPVLEDHDGAGSPSGVRPPLAARRGQTVPGGTPDSLS